MTRSHALRSSHIFGTTELAHLEKNLRAEDFALGADEIREVEDAVSKIKIVGDRYPASEQKQISGLNKPNPKSTLQKTSS